MKNEIINSTFYHGPLKLSQLGGPEEWKTNDGGKPIWSLDEELTYYLGSKSKKLLNIPEGQDLKVIMKEGFQSDGGSFNTIAGAIIGATGTGNFFRAFLLHDAIARTENFTFKESNIVLDEALGLLGMSWWRRQKIYYSLQGFGSPTRVPKLLLNAKRFVEFENYEHIT